MNKQFEDLLIFLGISFSSSFIPGAQTSFFLLLVMFVVRREGILSGPAAAGEKHAPLPPPFGTMCLFTVLLLLSLFLRHVHVRAYEPCGYRWCSVLLVILLLHSVAQQVSRARQDQRLVAPAKCNLPFLRSRLMDGHLDRYDVIEHKWKTLQGPQTEMTNAF